MVSPKRRNSADTQTIILDAAEELFAASGYMSVSVREISEVSNVSKSLILHHFGSKDALWEQTKARSMQGYIEAQLSLIESTNDDLLVLEASIDSFLQFLHANPNAVRIAAWSSLFDEPITPNRQDQTMIQACAARIRVAQDKQIIRDDIEPINILFMMHAGAVHWHQQQALYRLWHPSVSDQERNQSFKTDFIRIVLDGIRAKNNSTGEHRG